jgi:ubiquinone/menaquinone biosynthesis C-methylase UbiE
MARIDYEEAARSYDRARGLDEEGLSEWRTAVQAHIPTGSRVLDIGAGTGQWAICFATWFLTPVVAVEPSRGMRTEGRRKAAGLTVEFVGGCGEALPVRDSACEVAWLSTVIHHLRDLDGCAREVRRVVRPDGVGMVRSAFPGRTDQISLFRFFPEAARVVDSFPSVERTVAAFEAAGFAFGDLTPVAQRTVGSLAAFRARVSNRSADTALRLMDDEAYGRGLARLDEAIARRSDTPIVDHLDLLVFRG